ncbi:MAG: hypothetical protein HDS95_02135 [Bacteroidales bacterium]|nr:hypothetical protein [Bacteroidales bacterium]
MRKILIVSLISLFFASCGNKISKEENATSDDDSMLEFTTAYQNASSSPIVETKLFGDFLLGMSPTQVDSVFKIWVDKREIVNSLYAGKTETPIMDEFDVKCATISNSAYHYYVGLGYPLDIQFYPKYIDEKLVGLFCSVDTPEENMHPGDVYKLLADEFETSERGRKFKKIKMINNGDSSIIFIKDNLEIIFFPQKDRKSSSIQYINVPLQSKLSNSRPSLL